MVDRPPGLPLASRPSAADCADHARHGVGVAAVLTIVALGAGAGERVAEQIEGARPAVVGGARLGPGTQPTVTEADAYPVRNPPRAGLTWLHQVGISHAQVRRPESRKCPIDVQAPADYLWPGESLLYSLSPSSPHLSCLHRMLTQPPELLC